MRKTSSNKANSKANKVLAAVQYILDPPLATTVEERKAAAIASGADIDSLRSKIKAMVASPGGAKYSAMMEAYNLERTRRSHTLPAKRLLGSKARSARKILRGSRIENCGLPLAALAFNFKRLESTKITDKDLDRILAAVYFG